METLSSIFNFFKKEVTSFLRNIFAVLQNFKDVYKIDFQQIASFSKLIALKVRVAIFAVLLVLGLGGNAWGQTAATYSVSISTLATLEPKASFTNPAIVATGTDDGASSAQTIGFNFVYEGVTYTQFSASSNGLIALGATAVTTEFINSLSSTTNKPKLMPLWDDISTGLTANGGIYFMTSGSSGSRICKIYFGCYNTFNGANVTANTFFQVWLYETSNVIEFRYGAGVNVTTATIGISGTTVTNYNAKTNNLSSTSGTFANASGLTNLTVWPGSGTMYTFTPCSALTTYYSKSTGNLDVLTNWGTSSNGSGCNPANFTTAGITYIVQNNTTPTTSGSGWSVSGAGSIVKVGNGSSAITFSAAGSLSFDCNLEITGNATLSLGSNSMTLSGDLVRSAATAGLSQTAASASTVTFSGSSQEVNVTALNGTTATDSDITFNHVTISGSNVKVFYLKSSDRKLNINNFTVNTGAKVTLYSSPL